MNYKELSQFRFWETLDRVLSRKVFTGERRDSLYPSEASVICIDPKTKKAQVQGACARKVWYRLFKYPQSDPLTTKTLYTFEFGKYIEDFTKELCKIAGIYNNSSVKFWDKSSSVSGEVDIVVNIPQDDTGKYIIVEVKSTWGGMLVNGNEVGKARDLFTRYAGAGKARSQVQGKPKVENLLQIVTYLYKHRDDENLVGGKLVYMLRDNFNRTEFDIHLVEQPDKNHAIYVNGTKVEGFVAEGIEERFAAILAMARKSAKDVSEGKQPIPPDREYYLVYPDDVLEEKYKDGEVSKTAYEDHKKGKKSSGNWQCSYCSYKSLCWDIGQ